MSESKGCESYENITIILVFEWRRAPNECCFKTHFFGHNFKSMGFERREVFLICFTLWRGEERRGEERAHNQSGD